MSRVLNQPLEALPSDPPRLRALLTGITPAMARVSPRSWRNARSLLQAGLNHTHAGLLPRRLVIKPSALWSECLSATDPNSRSRYYLARLARYCTRHGIEPDAVDDALMARYSTDLIERSLATELARIARDTARAWNDAHDRYANWPRSQITIPDNRIRHSLPWEDFPSSLQAEVNRWLDHLGRDPFADRDMRPLRPASIKLRHKQLALYLGALAVFVAGFTMEWNRLAGERTGDLAAKRRERAGVERKLSGLVDAIADGLRTTGLQERLVELENKRAVLKAEIADGQAVPSAPVFLPNIPEVYRARVADLRTSMQSAASPEVR